MPEVALGDAWVSSLGHSFGTEVQHASGSFDLVFTLIRNSGL